MSSQLYTILGVDQSTSATKAVLYDYGGRPQAEASVSHDSSFPHPGWVEQNPKILWNNTRAVLVQVATEATKKGFPIRALGVTNQRETIVVWNRRTGLPIYPAIGWQCLRGQEITEGWKREGLASRVLEVTGLPLDPHFSAPKIAWVLENVSGARDLAAAGEIVFGTVDTWLIWNLTGGAVHATDPSNASRTLLYNLKTQDWDDELMTRFGIPRSMAPEIRMSDGDFGATTLDGLFQEPLPIRGVMGDSHAALFGLKCYAPGQAKATYGTGSSVMINLGPQLPGTRDGTMATSVAWGVAGVVSYVLEGNIHHSGDTLRWLVDDLGLFQSMEEWQLLAAATPRTDGVYLVPAFSGLGAPYWDDKARGALLGLVRGTTKGHVARAGLESLAYQVVDLLESARLISGLPLKRLAVDGGPTKNPVLMQFQADLGRVEVAVASTPNASVFGIALLAGMAVGLWPDLETLGDVGNSGAMYLPEMPDSPRQTLWDGWKRAVGKTRSSLWSE